MASSSDEQPKPPEPPAAATAVVAAASAVPPQTHAEWVASVQAYYAAAGGHPYAWPAQHLMAAAAAGAPFGTPVPFPVYHPGAAAAYYAHASMAAGVPYPTSEAVPAVVPAAAAVPEVKGKGKGGGAASPEKGSSGAPSGEDASRSGDSGSNESSETRDDDTDHKDSSAPKKRKSGNTSAEGEPSQAAVVRYAAVESPYPAKGRSASKLPVSAPGRAALPSATPNLNIGMDIWNASPALAVPAVQGEANPGLALARCDGVTQLHERELKRERRKQSNRESARRSRLRKQDSSAPKKRKSGNTSAEGEPSQAAVVRYAAVESPYPAKGRSASKLPVSAPGRAALPSATPNLNIGMDIWNASPALAVPAVQGEANPGLALARCDGVTQLDERELKRGRRKQSNRESARRSRLRKQQECEELARKVADLTTENSALRAELVNLKKACQDMEAENSRLLGGMVHSQGPSVTTTLGMSIDPPKVQHHDDEGQLHKKSSNNSNGNYAGGSHKPEANTR